MQQHLQQEQQMPLDELSKQDALSMGKLIRDRDPTAEIILNLTALGANTTAELAVAGYKSE